MNKPNHFHTILSCMPLLSAKALSLLLLPAAAIGADIEYSGGVTPTPPSASSWTVESVEVGTESGGAATLTLSGDGTITSSTAAIGMYVSNTSTVTITDNGIWSNTDRLFVGGSGLGTVNIDGNGRLQSKITIIGNHLPDQPLDPTVGVSSVNVGGHGEFESDSLTIGSYGPGALVVNGHASVTATNVNLGMGNSASEDEASGARLATIKVSENGSLTMGTITFGAMGGSGSLEIEGAGTVTADTIYLTSIYSSTPGTEGSSITLNGGSLDVGSITIGEFTSTPGAPATPASIRITSGTLTAGAITSLSLSYSANIDVSGGLLAISGSIGSANMQFLGVAEMSLQISGSGTVSSVGGYVTAFGNRTAETEVRDQGRWLNSGSLVINAASGDAAILKISDNALVESVGGAIASTYGNSAIVRVSGSGRWENEGKLTIFGNENTRLEITGGAVTSVGADISGGIVDVSGGKWSDTDRVAIGIGIAQPGTSPGLLKVSGSGIAETKETVVGWGGAGFVEVTGGTWNNAGPLTVGYFGAYGSDFPLNGNGRVEISGSGTVLTENATIGSEGAEGLVKVSNGSWTNSGILNIGQSTGTGSFYSPDGNVLYSAVTGGHGTLEITGGTVSTLAANIGHSGGGIGYEGYEYGPSTGIAKVSGGTWNTFTLTVGGSGIGTLEISGSGNVNTGVGVIVGMHLGSSGTVNLNGGVLSAIAVTKGSGDGKVNFNGGTLRLTADNSSLFSTFATGEVTIGEGGGTIDTGGYTVATDYVFSGPGVLSKIGSGTLSLNTASQNLSGIDASGGTLNLNGDIWNFSGNLSAGTSGNGQLDIVNAKVTSDGGRIGNGFSTTSKITVTSGTWTTNSDLHVGYYSNGSLDVSNGQVNVTGTTFAGFAGSGVGTINLLSSGELVTRQVAAVLGQGSLIFDGGTLTLSESQADLFANFANGAVRIDAGGGTIDTQGHNIASSVGFSGTGTLNFVGPGRYTLSGSSINRTGDTLVKQGIVEISGAGSLGSGTTTVSAGQAAETIGGILDFIDNSNAGTSTYVSAGAVVTNAYGGVIRFLNDSSAGNATLIAHGSTVSSIGGVIVFLENSSGGTAKIELNGNSGLFIDSGHQASGITIGSLAGNGNVTLGSKNLDIGSNNLSTTFSGVINGSGTVTKVGTGTLSLTGTNLHTGGVKIQAGTLLIGDVGATNSALGSGDVFVEAEGRLGGIGTVLGNTTIEGTLAPGNSPGTMRFAQNLSLTESAVIEMEISDLAVDFIQVDGLLTYGGTLNITLSGSYQPEVGELFHLFDAETVAVGTHFAAITFNVAGYEGIFDYDNGSLTIHAVPEPATTALIGGALLTFALRRRWAYRS